MFLLYAVYRHGGYNLARLVKLSVRVFRIQAAAQVPTENSKENLISLRSSSSAYAAAADAAAAGAELAAEAAAAEAAAAAAAAAAAPVPAAAES